jgi:hypothetical protein
LRREPFNSSNLAPFNFRNNIPSLNEGDNAVKLAEVLGIVLAASLIVMGVVALAQRLRKGPNAELVALNQMKKATWQMPPLEELTRPAWSLTRKVGMFTLRAYLLIAVILLVVKTVQIALGH